MRHAVTHRSAMDPEMSTDNTGEILPQSHSVTAVDGRAGRRAYHEPSSFQTGPHGETGVFSDKDEC